jgi:hypothetical protein
VENRVTTLAGKWTSLLVRDVANFAVIQAWWPYYAVRAVLLLVGVIVVWTLFRNPSDTP